MPDRSFADRRAVEFVKVARNRILEAQRFVLNQLQNGRGRRERLGE
jgi:hypothetical protein